MEVWWGTGYWWIIKIIPYNLIKHKGKNGLYSRKTWPTPTWPCDQGDNDGVVIVCTVSFPYILSKSVWLDSGYGTSNRPSLKVILENERLLFTVKGMKHGERLKTSSKLKKTKEIRYQYNMCSSIGSWTRKKRETLSIKFECVCGLALCYVTYYCGFPDWEGCMMLM